MDSIVILDSYFHYKVVERDGRIVLLEFPDDACPRMGDRDDFTDDEGEPIASWAKGETVTFAYRAGHGVLDPTDGVVCGDDLRYNIREAL